MSITLPEAEEFLTNNRELLNEMLRYQEKTPGRIEELQDSAEKTISQYHKLKTYILEKKMGLLNAGSRTQPGGNKES